MIIEGSGFKYFVNGESKTREELVKFLEGDMTVSIKGTDVFYSSPKQKSNLQHGGIPMDGSELASKRWFPVTEIGYISPELDYWNKKFADIENNLEPYQNFYDAVYCRINELLQEKLIKKHADGKTVLPKDPVKATSNSLGIHMTTGKIFKGEKETANKLNYELDWEFIEQMAERMATNKGKYKPYNWQLPMDTDKLKQSLLRHTLEIMKGNDSDEGRAMGHYESVALNAMMICYQLKNNL